MKENIINDYLFNYLGTTELSKKYGVHRITIQRYLKNANIELRKITPKTKVNHFYFSKYNSENSYWAGFILADGYIRTKKRFTLEIKLQKKDVTHLEKFKKLINYEGRIIEKKEYYSISISSKQIVSDLSNNFEIHNKKSLNCFISNKIPQEYLKDFIRGYFDGDGSITYTTIETINFLGTKKTVNFIRNYFYNTAKICLRSKKIPDIIQIGNVYVINYSGKSAFKCLEHIYCESKIYLNRKYDKYVSLIKKYR